MHKFNEVASVVLRSRFWKEPSIFGKSFPKGSFQKWKKYHSLPNWCGGLVVTCAFVCLFACLFLFILFCLWFVCLFSLFHFVLFVACFLRIFHESFWPKYTSTYTYTTAPMYFLIFTEMWALDQCWIGGWTMSGGGYSDSQRFFFFFFFWQLREAKNR